MKKNTILTIVLIIVILAAYMYYMAYGRVNQNIDFNKSNNTENQLNSSQVSKEFKMNSWMEKNGKVMSAHFSLNEIKVKKGDKVKIYITNTSGTHNFVIDKYNINVETPEKATTLVEFTADKVGSYEFYCSKFNHRSLGQRGILTVE